MSHSNDPYNPVPSDTHGNGHLNIFGEALIPCCYEPLTGYFRDGYCRTDQRDYGVHAVCAVMTQKFLVYSKSLGNDLMSPTPYFPGLKEGDKWCLCVTRWKEAYQTGCAPLVVLEATHIRTLDVVTMDQLIPCAQIKIG